MPMATSARTKYTASVSKPWLLRRRDDDRSMEKVCANVNSSTLLLR
jgi:hypothetical protein